MSLIYSGIMSIPSLKLLYNATYDARVKWKNILLELDVDKATIDSIEVKCHGDPDDCYHEGLSGWLDGGEKLERCGGCFVKSDCGM